ncbi:MAG: DUF2791 family P-loop domain-containing protein, partial [Acidobacteriota bacterium]|nr:DUF2791 family P-loop domain-containing protein [Acidobacteriota bacterium]
MIGEKLSDRYELTAELGRGGMGVVYKARDPLLNREVAVKLIPPSLLTPDAEQRFQSEAQLVAQMDHPGIVSIFDMGRHEGSLFFVMPVIEGTSLSALLREESLVLKDVLDVGIQVAEALDYSHTRGVVHRDIKSENIMVFRDEGDGLRICVMDFGLARAANVTRLTKTGMLVGTMAYMSPEQVVGKELDGRTDIYSLGSVLYECVVGRVPFTGEMQSVLYRIGHEIPQGPRDAGAEIEEQLEAIILSCLEKDPERRPSSAGRLAASLRQYKSGLRQSEQIRAVMMTQIAHAPRPALAPFVGREKEVKELQQRLNAAIEGVSQFVMVSGEPGIGKTRLLDELENLAVARQIRVLHGRFIEQSGAFPYHGFCEAIQEYFRQKETGGSSSEQPDLSDLAADLVSLFPMLSEIEPVRAAAGETGKDGAHGESHAAENRTQIFELLARALIRIGAGKPLVLMFEDLHGAEISIEALQYIVRRLGSTPTLILGTYRSSEVDKSHPLVKLLDGFEGDRHFAALPLGPMSPSEHRQFLKTLSGGSDVGDLLAERLFEGTEGNPFFTKELV